MRLYLPINFFLSLSTLTLTNAQSSHSSSSHHSSGVSPLHPLITQANTLLSSGQFAAAAKLYSTAIEQSRLANEQEHYSSSDAEIPQEYLLYYKRAMAYMGLARHGAALDDFERVIELTGISEAGKSNKGQGQGVFANAHLMKARIHLKEGSWDAAEGALHNYSSIRAKGTADEEVSQISALLTRSIHLSTLLSTQRSSSQWSSCYDTATLLLANAPYSIGVRSVRAECAIGKGDVAGGVGDLVRLGAVGGGGPSTTLMATIFR